MNINRLSTASSQEESSCKNFDCSSGGHAGLQARAVQEEVLKKVEGDSGRRGDGERSTSAPFPDCSLSSSKSMARPGCLAPVSLQHMHMWGMHPAEPELPEHVLSS